MMPSVSRLKTLLASLPLGAALLAAPVAHAQASATLTTLYSFKDNGDGANPFGALVQGSDGDFYGATSGYQSTQYYGTLFKVTAGGALTTLYKFGIRGSATTDGALPYGKLVQGSDGNFYGTTFSGGANGSGTVFKLTPDGSKTILHDFLRDSDETGPFAGLVQGSDGNFYGASTGGQQGTHFGSVYKITPGGDFTVLYAFTNAADGRTPYGTLLRGSDGNFYGTTSAGGVSGFGTVFKIDPAGTLTTLYGFSGGDGSFPKSALIQARDGNFYGTTSFTVFKLTPAGILTTLQIFPNTDMTGIPSGGLVQGADDNFYGTLSQAVQGVKGSIYQLTPGGTLTTLHTFNGEPDGASPDGGLVQGNDGNFYGLTVRGGDSLGGKTQGQGTVYKLAVSSAPAHPAFFMGESSLGSGVYYLQFASGNPFGYYSYLSDPRYLFHFDLGYEYVFDAADGKNGVYLYDFTTGGFFYTSPSFPFPYLYDFSLNTVLYYYPNPKDPTHYNTDGARYFFRFDTGAIFSK